MSKNPVRLEKVESKADDVIKTLYKSIMGRIEAWVLSHAMLSVVIFVMVGVSATESGIQYNAFDKII